MRYDNKNALRPASNLFKVRTAAWALAACLCNSGACQAKGDADLGKDANKLPKVITDDIMVPAAGRYR